MPDALARQISEKEIEELEEKAPKIKTRREYKRFQSVLLRVKEGKTSDEIGLLLQIHPRTARKHYRRRYLQEGLTAFDSNKAGPKDNRLFKRES